MTNFSIEALVKMAKTLFESDKDCDKVFVTRDGNIFKSDQKVYAEEHVKIVGGELQIFERKEIDNVISEIEEKGQIEKFKGSVDIAEAEKQAKSILVDAEKQAKSILSDAEKAKTEAEKQAKSIVTDAKKKAKSEADDLLKAAKSEADDLVKAAKAKK